MADSWTVKANKQERARKERIRAAEERRKAARKRRRKKWLKRIGF